MRLNRPAAHPRVRQSVRWRVAHARAWHLVVSLMAVVLAVSLALTILHAVSRTGHGSPGPYDTGSGWFFRLWMAVTRAVLGVDSFPRQDGNTVHEMLATFAAFVGAVIPALVIGVVAVRLFSTRLLTWRKAISVSTAAELTSDVDSVAQAGDEGILAVRFYKRIEKLTLLDLKVEAYLGYRATSLVDGRSVFRRDKLCILSPDATEVEQRVWPQVETAMPLTLWIPLRSRLRDATIAAVQGRELVPGKDYSIFVRAQGKVAGLNVEFHDQHRYSLKRDVQRGRAVPVEPVFTRRPAAWSGWDRFDEVATYGVFAYGSLIAPDTISDIVGHPAVAGVDYVRARLASWRRTWSVCTDNTANRRVRYYEPGTRVRPPVQILFLNIEQADSAADAVDGVVIFVDGRHLLALDEREGNYTRTLVTADVQMADGAARPDVVWAYVGKADRVERARQAKIKGTARIRRQYLDSVCDAFSSHEGLLRSLELTITPPPAPIVDLVRVVEPVESALGGDSEDARAGTVDEPPPHGVAGGEAARGVHQDRGKLV